MRGDPVPGGLVEPGTVVADGRLGGGHGQQQRGLPAAIGIRDHAWHAGEATLPGPAGAPAIPQPGAKTPGGPNAASPQSCHPPPPS